MEPKNIVIAVVLSGIILIAWNYIFPPPEPPPQPSPTQTVQTQAKAGASFESAALPGENATEEVLAAKEEAGPTVTVTTPLYTAVFQSTRASLSHFRLHHYLATIAPGSPQVDLIGDIARPLGPLGLLLNGRPTWRDARWKLAGRDLNLKEGEEGSLVFQTEIDGVEVSRELRFSADRYLFDETVRLRGLDPAVANATRLGFTLAAGKLGNEAVNEHDITRFAYFDQDGLQEETDEEKINTGFTLPDGMLWGGVDSTYFIMAVLPPTPQAGLRARYERDVFRMAVEKTGLETANGTASYAVAYYFGPKERDRLAMAPNQLAESVDLGIFSFIAKPLLVVLNFFQKYVGNYGVAIILLTIFVRILFWPLSQKSYKAMNKMKKLQPMMAKIREKHKDDRKKLNEELMNLYKTYKVNPAGGCAPMLIQIPVFIGLYQALLNAIELRHSTFITHVPFTDLVWLADLSAKDPYYVTPIVMGLTMLLQQKMTPAPGDPLQAKMMLLLPVFFTFLFLSFPSGLVVYWLVSNILAIGQQWLMLRKQE